MMILAEFGLSVSRLLQERWIRKNSDHVRLDEETMIKDLEQQKVYTYLGVDESCGTQHDTMKQKLKKGTCKKNMIDPHNQIFKL